MTIRELRHRCDMTQAELAKKLHIAPNTLSQYEKGSRRLDSEIAKQIADIFGVSLDEIYGYRPANSKKPFLIPVLGEVRAGYPCEAVENILDYEEVPASMASLGELFALKIKGDSMEPKFSEGDVIIVQKTPDLESGSIGVVLVNGDAENEKKPLINEDEELTEYLEELKNRPEMRMLFSLTKGATKEDVEKAVRIIEAALGK